MCNPRSPSILRKPRGFTLLEMMIASAVGIIFVAAAFAAFDLQNRVQSNSDRMLTVYSGLGLAFSPIQRAAESSGFRLPSAEFAVRVNNNVAAALPATPGNNQVPLYSGGTDAGTTIGLAPGTDVVELRSSIGARESSLVQGAPTFLGSGQVRLELDSQSAIPNPLTKAEFDLHVATTGPLFGPAILFRNTNANCYGLVIETADNAGRPRLTVQLTDRNLNANTAAPTTCPLAGMRAYAMNDRARYYVQKTNETTYDLMEQLSDPTPTATHQGGLVWQPAQVIASGIEDFQVSMVLDNPGNILGCGATTCPCWNNGTSCDPEAAANFIRLRGIRLGAVSRGVQSLARKGDQRPRMYDHAPGSVDDVGRATMESAVVMPNFDPNTTSSP